MINIEIKGYEDFVNRLGHLIADDTTNRAIKLAVTEIQRTSQKETPRYKSNLVNAYEAKYSNLEGELRNTARYGAAVHEGTKPHWTSVKNLEGWAKSKGINPYAVQRSIARKGTKGNPWMTRTVEKEGGKVQYIFNNEFTKLFKRLNG